MIADLGLDQVIERLVERLGGAVERDADLGGLTTYRVGGPAAALVQVGDEQALATLAAEIAGTGVELLVIGRGSNLLVADRGFPGVALQLGERFSEVHFDGTTMTVGGAANLPVVARRTVQEGLRGFEWAVGVPGSVGGAVRMNAGGHGAEIVDSIVSARVIDLRSGEVTSRTREALALTYRASALGPAELVMSATFELSRGEPDEGRVTLAEIVQWRRANQPGGQNAGSVFTNPPGDSAGRLIDTAGGRGLRIGTAEVSTKHANFIQSDDAGSADDVLAVMRAVQALVWEQHGVHLHAETHLVGFDEPLEEAVE